MKSAPFGQATRPSSRAAYRGRLDDPRAIAVVTQVLIVMETVNQIILGVSGTGSKVLTLSARLSMPLFLITVVVFLCWFWCCRHNAELFAPSAHKYPPIGAVATWLIPVLMWWAPRRVALDIWRASGATGSVWVINASWVAWLAKTVGVLGYMLLEPYGNPNGLFLMLIDVALAGLAILMIRQVTAAQHSRASATITAQL